MTEATLEVSWGGVLRAWGDAGEAPPAAIVAAVVHDLALQSQSEKILADTLDPDHVHVDGDGLAWARQPGSLLALVDLMEQSLEGIERGRTGDLMPPQARSGLDAFRSEAEHPDLPAADHLDRFQDWLRETFGPLPSPDEVLRCCRASVPLDPLAETLLPSRADLLSEAFRFPPREMMSEPSMDALDEAVEHVARPESAPPPSARDDGPAGVGPELAEGEETGTEDGAAPTHLELNAPSMIESAPPEPVSESDADRPELEGLDESAEPPGLDGSSDLATRIEPAAPSMEPLPTPEAVSEPAAPAAAQDPAPLQAAGTEIERLGREGQIREEAASESGDLVDSAERPVVRREFRRGDRPVSVHRAPAARRSARPRGEQGDSILVPADGGTLRGWALVLVLGSVLGAALYLLT